jgi:hypothetical protein
VSVLEREIEREERGGEIREEKRVERERSEERVSESQ